MPEDVRIPPDSIQHVFVKELHFFHKPHKEYVRLDFSQNVRVHMAPVYGGRQLENEQLYQLHCYALRYASAFGRQ